VARCLDTHKLNLVFVSFHQLSSLLVVVYSYSDILVEIMRRNNYSTNRHVYVASCFSMALKVRFWHLNCDRRLGTSGSAGVPNIRRRLENGKSWLFSDLQPDFI